MPNSANTIRQKILKQRRTIEKEFQKKANSHILFHIQNSSLFKNSKHIAFYMSVNNEPHLESLLAAALKMKKHCYLPVLHPLKKNRLWFVPYHADDALTENRFGIPEPKVDKYHLRRSPRALDLVLVPLVAFDENCHRIGMGSGFYDRTFEFKKNLHTKPFLMGVAYEMQKVPNTFPHDWDIQLDEVVTEKTVYKK